MDNKKFKSYPCLAIHNIILFGICQKNYHFWSLSLFYYFHIKLLKWQKKEWTALCSNFIFGEYNVKMPWTPHRRKLQIELKLITPPQCQVCNVVWEQEYNNHIPGVVPIPRKNNWIKHSLHTKRINEQKIIWTMSKNFLFHKMNLTYIKFICTSRIVILVGSKKQAVYALVATRRPSDYQGNFLITSRNHTIADARNEKDATYHLNELGQ